LQRAEDAPFDAHAVFGSALIDDEQILWSSQPDPRRLLTAVDLFLIPFSIFWCGFAIVWEYIAIRQALEGGSILWPLWGMPLLLIGLYALFGRFVYKKWKRRRTFYAVTDRRVLALERGSREDKIRAMFIESIPEVKKRAWRDGSGTIVFGSTAYWYDMYKSSGAEWMSGYWATGSSIPFFDIKDVATVERLVYDLRRDSGIEGV
jgi:hypothetical protein